MCSTISTVVSTMGVKTLTDKKKDKCIFQIKFKQTSKGQNVEIPEQYTIEKKIHCNTSHG